MEAATADTKDGRITVCRAIDGWRECGDSMRIDYIFSGSDKKIKSSRVIFNGRNRDVVSDHFGIIIETDIP